MAWEIETTDEYDAWFLEQAESEQEAVRMKLGGDKKGKDEKRFYLNLIKQAEKIYRQYRDDR